MNKEKSNFLLGLTTTVAVVSIIGFTVMSIAYVKISGAGPKNLKETAPIVRDNNQAQKPAPTPTPTPTPSPSKPVDIKVSASDHVRGNKNAKITITEFSDFQCPYCSRFHDAMLEVMEAYPNDVRWVYKHFPLDSIHPYARQAAEASECAGDQDKFWEYTDGLYANQSSIKPAYLKELAVDLGLNTTKFNSCLDSGKYKDKVNSDFNEGRSAGVTGTPGSFINGESLKGAVPFSQLQAKIEALK